LRDQCRPIRAQSAALCQPLAIEDFGVQPMTDASPPKWHPARTTWFFETFLLKPRHKDYTLFHDAFEHLFNSYYNGVGKPYPRPTRGLLSRPTVAEVAAYRAHVDVRAGSSVVRLSAYQTDAYARRKDCRLPTEFEWEAAAADESVEGNFVESDMLHPRPAAPVANQLFEDVSEWTCSSYGAYPEYRPLAALRVEARAR
tara:strand:- start:187 stop:783 length:597 start_codon:yes stop_codon:yes gene_type:complete